jgi:sigma-E factor negative regulatory protein RseC
MRKVKEYEEEITMMIETGCVTHVADGKAIVAVEKKVECATCHAECVCHLEKKVFFVEAEDPIGVRTNQIVQLAIPYGNNLQVAVVVYGVPLVGLIAGVLLGQYLGKTFGLETLSEILGGFGCLALALLVVKQYNRMFQRNHAYHPVITQVIASNG